jgi:hypothetical protein
MKQWQRPAEECWERHAEIKPNIAKYGIVMKISNVVLNSWDHAGIDADDDANKCSADTRNGCSESLSHGRPVSSQGLAFMCLGQAESLHIFD